MLNSQPNRKYYYQPMKTKEHWYMYIKGSDYGQSRCQERERERNVGGQVRGKEDHKSSKEIWKLLSRFLD